MTDSSGVLGWSAKGMRHMRNLRFILLLTLLMLGATSKARAVPLQATITGRIVYNNHMQPQCSVAQSTYCTSQYMPSTADNTLRALPFVKVYIVADGTNPYAPTGNYGSGYANSQGQFSIVANWNPAAITPLAFKVEAQFDNGPSDTAPQFEIVDAAQNGPGGAGFANSLLSYTTPHATTKNVGDVQLYDQWNFPGQYQYARHAAAAYLITRDYLLWATSLDGLGEAGFNAFRLNAPPNYQVWLQSTTPAGSQGGGQCCNATGQPLINGNGRAGVTITFPAAFNWTVLAHELSHLAFARANDFYGVCSGYGNAGDYGEAFADFFASRFGRVDRVHHGVSTAFAGYYSGEYERKGSVARECGCFTIPGASAANQNKAKIARFLHDLIDDHQDVTGNGGTCFNDTLALSAAQVFEGVSRSDTECEGNPGGLDVLRDTLNTFVVGVPTLDGSNWYPITLNNCTDGVDHP